MPRVNPHALPTLPSLTSGRTKAAEGAEPGGRKMKAAQAALPRASQGVIHEVKQRVLKVVTSRGKGAVQASHKKASREIGKLLRRLSSPSKNARNDFLDAKESISGLTRTMQPMTSRGTNYEQEFKDCVCANLKDMLTEDIARLHDSLATPRAPVLSLDPNHFVLRHFRDIQAAVTSELESRVAAAEARNDVLPAADRTEAGAQPELPSRQVLGARLHKGANPRLLKPLPRDNLGTAAPHKTETPQAPAKRAAPHKVLQPGRDFNPRLLAPKKGSGVA